MPCALGIKVQVQSCLQHTFLEAQFLTPILRATSDGRWIHKMRSLLRDKAREACWRALVRSSVIYRDAVSEGG